MGKLKVKKPKSSDEDVISAEAKRRLKMRMITGSKHKGDITPLMRKKKK